jgi:hypothetical protein
MSPGIAETDRIALVGVTSTVQNRPDNVGDGAPSTSSNVPKTVSAVTIMNESPGSVGE